MKGQQPARQIIFFEEKTAETWTLRPHQDSARLTHRWMSTITRLSLLSVLRTTPRTAKHVLFMYECPYVCCLSPQQPNFVQPMNKTKKEKMVPRRSVPPVLPKAYTSSTRDQSFFLHLNLPRCNLTRIVLWQGPAYKAESPGATESPPRSLTLHYYLCYPASGSTQHPTR